MKQSAPTANRRSVPLLIGCGVLAVVVIVGLIGAAVFVLTRPAGLPQPPPGAAALLVHLTTPLDASDVPLNEPTSIQVEALGTSPIASLELWVDGNPAETKTAPRPDLLQFDASWSWLPDAPG